MFLISYLYMSRLEPSPHYKYGHFYSLVAKIHGNAHNPRWLHNISPQTNHDDYIHFLFIIYVFTIKKTWTARTTATATLLTQLIGEVKSMNWQFSLTSSLKLGDIVATSR